MLAAYLALLLGSIVDGSQEHEERLHSAVEGQTLAPMLDLLKEFSDFNQSVQQAHQEHEVMDDVVPSQQQQEPPMSSSLSSPSSSLTKANSFMTLTLNDDDDVDNTSNAAVSSPLYTGPVPILPRGLSSRSPPASPLTILSPTTPSSSLSSSTASSAQRITLSPLHPSTSSLEGDLERNGISFTESDSSSAEETRKSFLRIMEILQTIESRHSGLE